MYGVSEQLMQRMQKRMKEKIYREMIQEQQKYKKKYKERNKEKNLSQSRYKTQPNQYQDEYQFNKYEDTPKPSSFLHEESTFLPVINKRYSPSENETSDSKINPEYKSYINRRNKRINQEELPHRKRTSASAIFQPQHKMTGKVQESQEEAEQYLNQCEQIINNLRMLNKRNQEKLKQRQSKKALQAQQQKSSPKYKSFSSNVFGQTPEYRLNSFNSKRRDFNLKNTSLTNPYRNEQLQNNSFRVYSPFQEESPQNQFSEFNDLQTKPKERANALTISVNSKPNSVGMRSKEINMREKTESQFKTKENFKRLSPIKKEDERKEEEQEQAQEEKAAGNDKKSSAKDENKRQKAIVKYLKKARLRGNLLYQKIQSKKTQPKKSEQPNANPENPASNESNPNQEPNPSSNPPQNPPPNPDKSSLNPPFKQ